MTLVLAADTSTNINTVALCRGGQPLVEFVADTGRVHAERLLPAVHWVLSEAGISLHQVDLLAISAGPGSFTGLRIGIAAWKGLAFGACKPLIAVPTLDAMSRLGALGGGLVCPLLDARMGEVYGAIYRYDCGLREKMTPDRVCQVEDIVRAIPAGIVCFLGDGAALYRERIGAIRGDARFAPAQQSVPRASEVAAEAFELMSRGAEMNPALAEPVYLRESQAETNRARAQQREAVRA